MEAKPKIVIYTDGSCSPNPGQGGYGIILYFGSTARELRGGFRRTTNQRMELIAAIKALELLKRPCEVRLWADSTYVVGAIEKAWCARWTRNGYRTLEGKAVANVDLWLRLAPLLRVHTVAAGWVRGHEGLPDNERVHELSVLGRKFGPWEVDEGYEQPLPSQASLF